MTVKVLTVLSAVFAGAAAVLWWCSAKVRMPTQFRIGLERPDSSFFDPMGPPLGIGPVAWSSSEELQQLGNALRRQSRLSAAAAVCAGVSAACQAVIAAL